MRKHSWERTLPAVEPGVAGALPAFPTHQAAFQTSLPDQRKCDIRCYALFSLFYLYLNF